MHEEVGAEMVLLKAIGLNLSSATQHCTDKCNYEIALIIFLMIALINFMKIALDQFSLINLPWKIWL